MEELECIGEKQSNSTMAGKEERQGKGIYMKGHNKKNGIHKEGEDCGSCVFSGKTAYVNEKKRKKEVSVAVDSFDPFAIPNLFRPLEKGMFGSVTEEIEALRALKIRRLNSGLKRPIQSIMCLDVEKTESKSFLNLAEEQDSQPASSQNAINKQVSPLVHPVDVDPLVSLQANETLSDQSVTQPEHDLIHLKVEHSGKGDKVTVPIIIIDSDDEDDAIQSPFQAIPKETSAEPSLNDLMVRGIAEKEATKEDPGSEATKMDIGLNKSIDLCDFCVVDSCFVERNATKEELSYRLEENAFGMDESVDQVSSSLERKASGEKVETVPNIDAGSAKYIYNETDGNMVIKEENAQIDIADENISKPSESVNQSTSSSERKASKEAETLPNIINVRSAKYTCTANDDFMIPKEVSDQIDISDDMGSNPSENAIEMEEQVDHIKIESLGEELEICSDMTVVTDKVMHIGTNDDLVSVDKIQDFTSSSERKASKEEEAVPNIINVRSDKYTCTATDDFMMPKEASDQIDIADDMGSNPSENAIEADKQVDHIKRESSGEELEICSDMTVMSDKGMHIDTNDDLVPVDNNQDVAANDGLADIWKEMAYALECTEDTATVPTANEDSKGDEECDHSFIRKDDLGDVCRICGVIGRGMETIVEFQSSKVKRTSRTYISEPRNMIKRGLNGILSSGVNSLGNNSVPTEIYVHPRHRAKMKPHQVEGFNFLCSNLLADEPGVAHAPGSGKTFMIISFIQSFLAKYPEGRPLVVLPKGILGTWKKEFQTWQIEDIPILDFYTSKAENRYQQLDVLLQWENQKSILLLGYKQFSAIVCDSRNCKVAAECQEKLLKVPTILILDEGHTPRNEETDVLQSLAKVRTRRKVVLSGTLYQNHVKEVFNILNLVRPKFLKFDTSKAAVSRIMSKVQISGARKHLKAGSDLAFFDLVEYTLQKDENLERKVAVIKDLREMTSNVLHYYKGDCLDELPGLIDYTVVLNLSAKQKEEVQKLKKAGNFSQISSGSALYVHPHLKYFSEKNPAAGDRNSTVINERIDQMLAEIDVRHGVKMKFFLNILGLCESTGEKLLVFSQFILPLKLLERLSMKSKGWIPGREIFSIRGDSTSEQREWSMQQFNSSPDAKVFFGSIKACGEGISLVGASRIIILDVHLNPSVTRQAIGRAFRPGQTRKVYTYRLVAANSPEEDNYLACLRKESISKIWFEWSESCEFQDFEMNTVDLDKVDDLFLQSPKLQEDIKDLYKR